MRTVPLQNGVLSSRSDEPDLIIVDEPNIEGVFDFSDVCMRRLEADITF